MASIPILDISEDALMNQTQSYRNYVTHLECGWKGDSYPAGEIHGLSRSDKPLIVKYDLQKLSKDLSREELQSREKGMWRYREFLPVKETRSIVSLGEVETPLISLSRLEQNPNTLFIKDESRLPTASFKARGIAMAISMAKELGIMKVAMPTNGNAGAALSAYASRAGMESYIFCPSDTPEVNLREIAAQGAAVWRVNGLINDCGRIVGEGKAAMNWFDLSTLKEPYRIEGKKTMGLELADQMEWQVPDVILYPTGGGTGLIGMWKAFQELKEIGWITGKLPRMVAVQSSGCAPMVRAFEQGDEVAEFWEHAETIAMGIRVPVAIGDFLILRAIRESDGFAVAVDDEDILSAREEVATSEGVLMCPEGAATYAAWKQEVQSGRIAPTESAVLFNCASGLKYKLPPMNQHLDCTVPMEHSLFQSGNN